MARLRLEKEEEVGILLQLAVVGIVTLGRVNLLKMLLDFILLQRCEGNSAVTSKRHDGPHREPFDSR